MRSQRWLVLAAVVLILAASAAVRLYRLDHPKGYIFDEVYYAKDAVTLLDGRLAPKTASRHLPGDEVSWPHPYYGKMAIALGVLAFGDTEVGWRFVPALAGLALLACVYPIARRLGLRREWSLLALVLAAADLLGIAQSRIGTLDIFVALWTVLTIYLTLRAVQSSRRALWLALAGVSAGLALGTKWSGGLAILVALVLLVVLPRPRGASATLQIAGQPHTAQRVRTVLLASSLLIVLPLCLYVASYAAYFAAGHGLADWWHLQREMLTFNLNLDAEHTYASLAPTWIIDVRPVWYHFKEYAAHYYGVVAMGHPVLWWTASAAMLVLPVMALAERRRALAIPALLVALLYFPWFATSRTSFLYYMMPVAPLLAVLVATALASLAGRPPQSLQPDAGPRRRRPPASHAASMTAGAAHEAPTDTQATALTKTAALAAAPPTAHQRAEADEAAGADERWVWTPRNGVLPVNGADADLPRLRADTTDHQPDSTAARTSLVLLFLGTAALVGLFWSQIAHFLATVFYHLPAQVAPVLGIAVSSLAVAAAVIVLAWSASRPRGPATWRLLAWLFAGVVLGLTVAFAPIILDMPVTPERFYRLMWLPTWI